MSSINVWVSTYSGMASGLGEGSWVSLPLDKEELAEVLPKAAHAKGPDDEIGIFDVNTSDEYSKLGSEYFLEQPVESANALAKVLEDHPEANLDAVRAVLAEDPSATALMAANAVLQADEIAFTEFESPVASSRPTMAELEEHFGCEIIDRAAEEIEENPDLAGSALSVVVEGADPGSVGRAAAMTGALTPSGYVDLEITEIDLEKYSLEEVEEMAFGDDGKTVDPYDQLAPEATIDSWEHTGIDTYIGSVTVGDSEFGFVLQGTSHGEEAGDVDFYGCHNGGIYFMEEPDIPVEVGDKLGEIADKIRVGHSFEARGEGEHSESLDEMMSAKSAEAELGADTGSERDNEQERE